MAGDFLSQAEVDALLRGVCSEVDSDDDCDLDFNKYQKYNLGVQERIVRGRMPALEGIHDRFARLIRIELSKFLQRNIELSVGPVRIQKCSEFIRNLVVPSNINLVKFNEFRDGGWIVFDPNLVFLTVDNLFGGDGRFHVRVEGRDFSPIEERIIDNMLSIVMDSYCKSFSSVHPVSLKYLSREMNSHLAVLCHSPSEIVVSVTFTIEMGGATADMHIAFPYATFEPISKILHSGIISEVPENEKVKIKTDNLPVEISFFSTVSPEKKWKINDLLKLKVGDEFEISSTSLGKVDDTAIIESKFKKDYLTHSILRISKD